jgi:hypothetical protein
MTKDLGIVTDARLEELIGLTIGRDTKRCLQELQRRRQECGDCMMSLVAQCYCDTPVPSALDEEYCAACGRAL